jgi:hypothetical protein
MNEMVYSLAAWRVQARGTMYGGHPAGISRRRRIALAQRTDKRIPTR